MNIELFYEVYDGRIRRVFSDLEEAKMFAQRIGACVFRTCPTMVFNPSEEDCSRFRVECKTRNNKCYYDYLSDFELAHILELFKDHVDSFSITIYKLNSRQF